ncbi:MAG: type II secretion system protein [Candidatus Terrybacteria bacterium]|nr:type II secretion system protein [Candidatus Terrybacteria bacterium]
MQQQGSLLLEILISMAVLVLILSLGVQIGAVSFQANKISREKDVALNLLNETMEAVRAVSDEKWQNLYNLTKIDRHYYPQQSGGKWIFVQGDEAIAINGVNYTRYFIVENTSRDPATNDIQPVYNELNEDFSTQKVSVFVTWPGAGPLSSSQYIFRWRNKICSQTEWQLAGSTGVKICPDTSYDTKTDTIATDGSLQLRGVPVAPAWQASGAIATSLGDDVTVTLPAHQANDIFLLQLLVTYKDDTITWPSGWTQIATVDHSSVSRYWWAWKRAESGTEPNPLIDKSTATGDTYAAVTTYRGASNTGDPWEVKGVPNTATTASHVLNGITTFSANSLIVASLCGEDNSSTPQVIFTATDPLTLTKYLYVESNVGSDGACTLGAGAKAVIGPTGDVTAAWTQSVVGSGGIVLALKPAPASAAASGELSSVVFESTGSSDGPAYNSIMWKGTIGTGKTGFQLATSDCPNAEKNPPTCDLSGAWNFRGSDICGPNDWYYSITSDNPMEIKGDCLKLFNNKRYFRYKFRICSASDCSSSGAVSPAVDEIIVNWAP